MSIYHGYTKSLIEIKYEYVYGSTANQRVEWRPNEQFDDVSYHGYVSNIRGRGRQQGVEWIGIEVGRE